MSIRVHSPYEMPEPSTNRWVMTFILLSLLAHAVIITAILLITVFMPLPKITVPVPPPQTTLTLEQAPPAPPPKQVFVPTNPDPTAKPKPQPIISANDTNLKSQSKIARKPDSIMPDVTGKEHAPDLNTTPNVQAPPKQEVSSTPPTPKQDTPQKPTPPQPNPDKAQQPPPKPPEPHPKPKPPTPAPKPAPLVDENGFPLLPPIAAPTMAPPNSAAPAPTPAPSQQQQAASVHGSLGMQGVNSPAAMASELGKYKQYVYSVVGSYWYPDINQHFGIIPVGVVHIQFTIHSDGTLTGVSVLNGNNLEILRDISLNSLRKPAPYKPFNEALIKEIGDSFTDDFTFSVY